MDVPSQPVELVGPGWSSGPLVVAGTRRARRRGAGGVPPGMGILLRGRSVCAPAGSPPLWAIALDLRGMVRGVALLESGGLLADRHAGWFAEIPARRVPPQPGWRLRVRRRECGRPPG